MFSAFQLSFSSSRSWEGHPLDEAPGLVWFLDKAVHTADLSLAPAAASSAFVLFAFFV